MQSNTFFCEGEIHINNKVEHKCLHSLLWKERFANKKHTTQVKSKLLLKQKLQKH